MGAAGYLLLGTALPLQVLGLILKAGLLLRERPTRFAIGRDQGLFLTGIGVLAAVSFIMNVGTGGFDFRGYLVYGAVAASVCLTLLLVARDDFTQYAVGFVSIPYAVAVVHVFLAVSGGVDDHFGRVLYVGNTHPNLGGEIASAAVLLASLSLRPRSFTVVVIPLTISVLLLQARAALACILLLVLVWAVYEFRRLRWSRGARFAAVSLLMLMVMSLWTHGSTGARFVREDVLRVSDENRGIGSGFTGRVEPWGSAWEAFLETPLIGSGIDFRAEGDVSGVHNAVLYGLARHGALSLLIWVPLVRAFANIWYRDRKASLCLLACLPLVFLNDRFINLNPYPFGMYVTVLALGRGSRLGPLQRIRGRHMVKQG
ncbi:O-antigen ligase family protein [Euzebya sp.]|uniref:O-antigen ligase family protein n=1 Tax=Euzebya sp. TaxID=1971409 RepID=UPI003510E557